MGITFTEDDDLFPEACGSQSDRKMSESLNGFDVLNVNQLMESVRNTCSNPIKCFHLHKFI